MTVVKVAIAVWTFSLGWDYQPELNGRGTCASPLRRRKLFSSDSKFQLGLKPWTKVGSLLVKSSQNKAYDILYKFLNKMSGNFRLKKSNE
jgi:hypothetical protein